jgi:hypothetical protein
MQVERPLILKFDEKKGKKRSSHGRRLLFLYFVSCFIFDVAKEAGLKENPHLKSGLAARTSDHILSPFAGKTKHRFAMRAFAETMDPDFPYSAEKQSKLRLNGVPEFQKYLIFPLSFVNVA